MINSFYIAKNTQNIKTVIIIIKFISFLFPLYLKMKKENKTTSR